MLSPRLTMKGLASSVPMSFRSPYISVNRDGLTVTKTGTLPVLMAHRMMAAACLPLPMPVWSAMMMALPLLIWWMADATEST